MSERRFSFRELLAPMEPDKFMARFYRQRPLHLKGHARKFEHVFSWQRMNRLLNATALWNAPRLRLVRDNVPVPPQHFSRPAADGAAGNVLRAVPRKVAAMLADGTTINLNEIEQLDENLAGVSAAIAMAFACRSNCNLYLSRKEVVAFASHFDTSDVFALHIAGRKRWRIYERPFEAPAYVDGYHNGAYPDEYHEAHKGRVLMQPTLAPGDVLYIPAGFYHDAVALTDTSLHLTFSVDLVRGLVLAEILEPLLADEPLFREPLPDPDAVDEHDAHMRRLAARIAERLVDPAVMAHIRERQKNQAFWDVPGFTLPAPELEQLFRVKTLRVQLAARGNTAVLHVGAVQTAVTPDEAPVVRWILDADAFTPAELAAAFPEHDRGALRGIAERLVQAGAVEPVEPYIT